MLEYLPTDNNIICWNCCLVSYSYIGMPIKYMNDIFTTYGNFCSLECCSKYCFDTCGNNKYEIYSLINLYYNKLNNTINKKINIAKDKLLLNIFGGPLTPEEYKENFDKSYYEMSSLYQFQ